MLHQSMAIVLSQVGGRATSPININVEVNLVCQSSSGGGCDRKVVASKVIVDSPMYTKKREAKNICGVGAISDYKQNLTIKSSKG